MLILGGKNTMGFKKSLFGFNCDEVMNYIENMHKTTKENELVLNEKLDDATSKLEASANENAELKAKNELLSAELKEITEKYGLDVENLNHVSELEGFLQKVKENEPLLYPYRPHYGVRPWTDGIYELIQSDVAIRTDGSSPEVFFLYDTPEYQEGLKTLHEWYKKGYIRSDILSMGSDAADLKLGKYVVNQSGWAPGAEVSPKINNGGKDMVLKPIMKPYLTKDKALATMNAIGKSSKNAEKAIKMIELINTNKELYNLITV